MVKDEVTGDSPVHDGMEKSDVRECNDEDESKMTSSAPLPISGPAVTMPAKTIPTSHVPDLLKCMLDVLHECHKLRVFVYIIM